MSTSPEPATRKEKHLMALGISLPLWLPIVYLALLLIEVQFTKQGPLNELGPYAFLATPAVGAMPILMSPSIPWPLKIIIAPVYYCFGLIVAGIIGWLVGCWWGVVPCH